MSEESSPGHITGPSDRHPHRKPPSASSFTGTRIGDCEVLEKLGEGGSSDIYLARNTREDEVRVLKILKLSLVANRDFHKRFQREADLSANLHHPNILRVYNTGTAGRVFFIEMERIEGESLRSLLNREGPLPESRALGIAADIASALAYAHTVRMETPEGKTITGLLHRDIKPENVMLLPDGTAKLMDFGAARPMGVESTTTVGTIVGTFHYMSPEQIGGGELTVRSDFFSLGTTLYEMLTGHNPFHDADLALLVENIRNVEHEHIRTRNPEVSPATGKLCEQLLLLDPAKRGRDTAEIVERIAWAAKKLEKFHPSGGTWTRILQVVVWTLTALAGIFTVGMVVRTLLQLR